MLFVARERGRAPDLIFGKSPNILCNSAENARYCERDDGGDHEERCRPNSKPDPDRHLGGLIGTLPRRP
jgi:hypothetical protein